MIEVMGGLNFRKSINLDNINENVEYTISGHSEEQFGVLFYTQSNAYEINGVIGA